MKVTTIRLFSIRNGKNDSGDNVYDVQIILSVFYIDINSGANSIIAHIGFL
jgi:hypothetical protein